uniref:ShKT domain-containing protein n=1 Tax=Corethron hystrix TaxID=216773 RepID=A0A7S1B823_9STRA|mmetsp:Transcript_16662/g.37466  ORF Transcript_16662/g.37466 Transcript_16662/m.37466 type:complete len:278 (+) Transcript_16662:128-961(+)
MIKSKLKVKCTPFLFYISLKLIVAVPLNQMQNCYDKAPIYCGIYIKNDPNMCNKSFESSGDLSYPVSILCEKSCNKCQSASSHLSFPPSVSKPTSENPIPCTNSEKYFNNGNCEQLSERNCDSWNRFGKLMKNYCAKKCNFCGPERCLDDETFYFNGDQSIENKCSKLPSTACWMQDNLGRRVKEFCRGLCKVCEKKEQRSANAVPKLPSFVPTIAPTHLPTVVSDGKPSNMPTNPKLHRRRRKRRNDGSLPLPRLENYIAIITEPSIPIHRKKDNY